jgi:hypothetical protein
MEAAGTSETSAKVYHPEGSDFQTSRRENLKSCTFVCVTIADSLFQYKFAHFPSFEVQNLFLYATFQELALLHSTCYWHKRGRF